MQNVQVEHKWHTRLREMVYIETFPSNITTRSTKKSKAVMSHKQHQRMLSDKLLFDIVKSADQKGMLSVCILNSLLAEAVIKNVRVKRRV